MMSDIEKSFRAFVEFLGISELEVDEQELTESWLESCDRAVKRRVRLWIRRAVTVSAAAAVLCLAYFAFRPAVGQHPEGIELYALQQQPADISGSGDIRLIMSEGAVMNIGGAKANIDYAQSGKIIVESDTITDNADDTKPRYNQLIVPHGKRTHLHLSDGSRLCVNSGTRVVYPIRFGTGDREIFIEGEAYLEVAKDENRPFIVKTGGFDVRVLGTKFNVFAYPDAQSKQIVLVEGSVMLADGDKNVKMRPGELVEATGTGLSEPRKVDVERYISWISNTLSYEREPLRAVFDKLHHYYGLDFDVRCDISKMYVSGKLDLQETPEDVLSSLSFSIPVECERQGDQVFVTLDD